MARVFRDNRGRTQWVEYSAHEIARLANTTTESVCKAARFLPAPTDDGAYVFPGTRSLRRGLDALALMRTGMSAASVDDVETEGLLSVYARLAADCPSGITAHVYRSYVAVLLAQRERGVMVDAATLSEIACLSERDPKTGEMVISERIGRRHLILLQACGMLTPTEDRWEFARWPAILHDTGGRAAEERSA